MHPRRYWQPQVQMGHDNMQLEAKDSVACTHSASDHVKTSPNEFFCIYQNRFNLILLTENLKKVWKSGQWMTVETMHFFFSKCCLARAAGLLLKWVCTKTRVFRTSVQLPPRRPMNWHELCPPRIYKRQYTPASWIFCWWPKFPKNLWLHRL